jgi:hypothetical protein
MTWLLAEDSAYQPPVAEQDPLAELDPTGGVPGGRLSRFFGL